MSDIQKNASALCDRVALLETVMAELRHAIERRAVMVGNGSREKSISPRMEDALARVEMLIGAYDPAAMGGA